MLIVNGLGASAKTVICVETDGVGVVVGRGGSRLRRWWGGRSGVVGLNGVCSGAVVGGRWLRSMGGGIRFGRGGLWRR